MGFLSRRLRTRRSTAFFLAIGLAAAAIPVPQARAAGIFASEVSAYTPGSAPANFQTATAALGSITGDTSFGGATPFNPPFATGHIVIMGAGGSLTLRLATPVAGANAKVGVFVNNGLVDFSSDGSGLVGAAPVATFSALSQAIVSVSSAVGGPFVPLNGGAPITFDNPTNAFLDTTIDNYFQQIGTQPADQSKPFTGRLNDFAGETYSQMRTRLDGSAGGTWLDVTGAGLPDVRYVKFDVPSDVTYRMAVDSVSAVPEPGSVVAGLALALLASRRGRVRVSA